MDFIERIFGISPDGGDGSTELMYIAVLLLVAALFAWRRLAGKKSAGTRARRSAP
jgi:MYXO-CTERM domain-containing protein